MTVPANVPARRLIRALLEDGYRLVRQRGSHQTYARGRRKVTVAVHRQSDPIPPGTMAAIVKGAGWTDQDQQRLGLLP